MKGQDNITNIYNSYIDELYNYGIYQGFENEVIMDAIHDVFCNLSEDVDKLKQVVNIKFYLFRSLKNRLLDIAMSKRKNIEINTDIETQTSLPFNFQINFDDRIIDKEERQLIKVQVEEMLNSLTNRQREAIYLRYIQEYDYNQIAEILNISVNSTRKLVSNAIIRLREKYGVLVTILFYI